MFRLLSRSTSKASKPKEAEAPAPASDILRSRQSSLSKEELREEEHRKIGGAMGASQRNDRDWPEAGQTGKKTNPKKEKKKKKKQHQQPVVPDNDPVLAGSVYKAFGEEFGATMLAFLRQQGVRNMDVLQIVSIPVLLKEARDYKWKPEQVKKLKIWLEGNRVSSSRESVKEFKKQLAAEKKRKDDELMAHELQQSKMASELRQVHREEDARVAHEMQLARSSNIKEVNAAQRELELEAQRIQIEQSAERSKYMEEAKAVREKQEKEERHERAVREAEIARKLRQDVEEGARSREQM